MFRQLSLDRNRYKVFRAGPSVLPPAVTPEPVATLTPNARGPVSELFPASTRGTAEPRPIGQITAVPSKNSTARTHAAQPPEWAALQSLFNLRAQFAGSSQIRPEEVTKPTGISVFGLCGGVGATTIVSALGRIWAKADRRVMLVDQSSPSLLPLHFGAQSPHTGTATFLPSGQIHESPVYVICGGMDDSVRALMSEIDCYYSDSGLLRLKTARSSHSPLELPLAVLIPDTRCLVELNRLQREGAPLPYLLLNQFDDSQPLHREVHYRLAKQFNDRLIPLTISVDPDVSAALAQGTTIIDYSPNSPVTDDLYKLNDWLTDNSTKLSPPELAAGRQRL